jgi:hypothetical protein
MCHRQGLAQETEPLLDLLYVRIGLGEQSQTIRPKHLGPCGLPDSQALPHLGDTLLPLPLSCLRLTRPLGQRPPTKDCPLRKEDSNPLLGRKSYPCLCPLLCQWCFPAELMEPGRKAQGKRQAKGVRHFLGQRQRLVAPVQGGLVWITQPPQGQGGVGATDHAGVLSVADGMGTVPLGIVEGNPLRKMGLGRGKLTQIVQGVPKGIVGFQEERGVAGLLGQAEEVLPQLPRRPQLHPMQVKVPQAP